MNQNLLIAALILFLAVGAAGANKAEKAGPETLFLTSQQRIVKVVPESDGSVWVLRAGSTLIERYAGPGVIAEGFDIAGLRISSLPLPIIPGLNLISAQDLDCFADVLSFLEYNGCYEITTEIICDGVPSGCCWT